MRFDGRIYSKVLDMSTGLTVVGPDVILDKPYKVIYMLHGMSGDAGDWADKTLMSVYASEYNVFFIMPEVQRSFYNDMKMGVQYFTYITEELPKICKQLFNISHKREDTAVMGLSMGGFGALKCALNFPENYYLCCAFSSGGIYLEKLAGLITVASKHPEEFDAIFGIDKNFGLENDISYLAKKTSQEIIKPIIHTTCGTEDFLYVDNKQFSEEMKQLNFEYYYDEWEGSHNWYFWNESLKKMLDKYYEKAPMQGFDAIFNKEE